MPKRYHKTMKGGFWNSWWHSTKKATSDAYNSVTGTKSSTPSTTTSSPSTTTSTPSTTTSTPSTTTSTPSTTTTSTTVPASSESATVGGRKRRSRAKRGGYSANSPTTGIAFYASPVSDIKNAQPHNWVGGRTKRRRKHKHSKSCKQRKH